MLYFYPNIACVIHQKNQYTLKGYDAHTFASFFVLGKNLNSLMHLTTSRRVQFWNIFDKQRVFELGKGSKLSNIFHLEALRQEIVLVIFLYRRYISSLVSYKIRFMH